MNVTRTAGDGVAPGRHDRAAREAALIEAATAVFAERGFEAATTREVAERAGCAEGLIHRYFGGKRGLLLAILARRTNTVEAAFRAALPDRERLVDELTHLLTVPLDLFWQHRDFMRVAIAQAIVDPDVSRRVDELRERIVAAIAAKLTRHRQAGRLRADADVAALAEAVADLAFSTGFVDRVMLGRDRARIERVLRAVVEALARGLTPPPKLIHPAEEGCASP
jgi:AcrR family transcriptional regulator